LLIRKFRYRRQRDCLFAFCLFYGMYLINVNCSYTEHKIFNFISDSQTRVHFNNCISLLFIWVIGQNTHHRFIPDYMTARYWWFEISISKYYFLHPRGKLTHFIKHTYNNYSLPIFSMIILRLSREDSAISTVGKVENKN